MASPPTIHQSSSPPASPVTNVAELLASFTSTSSDSTAVRIARERRKQEREARWVSRKTETEAVTDGLEGLEGPESEDGLRREGWCRSTPPRLRVQEPDSIGGRSYSPSLNGSPLPSTPGPAPFSSLPADDLPAPQPSPPTARRPATIGEIPPVRPKPAPSPVSTLSSSPGSGGGAEVKVTMSLGLMERLKAKKAASVAGGGGDALAKAGGVAAEQIAGAVPLPGTPTQPSASPPSRPPPPFIAVSSPPPIGTASPRRAPPSPYPHIISPPHPSPPFSTTPLDESPLHASGPRSTQPVQDSSFSTSTYHPPNTSRTSVPSPIKPSAKERVEERLAQLERLDGEEDRASTRWDIQGNEFSFEPTPLSPLTERSDRATISTRCDSLRSQQSFPPVWNSYFDDPTSAPPSSVGGRQLPDGTYRPTSFVKPLPSSIFDAESRSSSRLPSGSSSIHSPTQERVRNPSPTRRMSPELQKRAAAFETQGERMRTPDFGAERERRRAERGFQRKAASEVEFVAASHVSAPRTPALQILCEGTLLVPPVDSQSQAESLARWKEWDRRYSVLTADTLEFRTDSIRQSSTIVALILADCVDMRSKFEEQNSQFRPFAVVLNDGGEELFAATDVTTRVDWMMTIGGAIDVANSNATKRWMRQTPELDLPLPLSAHRLPSSPRKVEADQRSIKSGSSLTYAESVHDLPMPSRPFPLRSSSIHSDSTRPPFPTFDGGNEKDPALFKTRPASVFSQGSRESSLFGNDAVGGSRSKNAPPNSSLLNEEQRDLFAYYWTGRVPHASTTAPSVDSTSNRSGVSPAPPAATSCPSSRSPSKSDFENPIRFPSASAISEHYRSDSPRSSKHRRARSEAMVDVQGRQAPNFLSVGSGRSMKSCVPQELKPVLRTVLAAVQDRNEEIFSTLERQNQHFRWIEREVGEIRRHLQRHQEGRPDQPANPSLAESLDYLSTYSKFLLRATDRQTGTFALSHSRPYLLPAHEDALCHIADLLQTFLADADSVSLPRMHQSPRDLKFVGVQTQTTRGGAFSPAEHEEWTCDLNRTAVEASVSSETSSQAIVRERREAERRLEGRDRTRSPTRLTPTADSNLPTLPSSPSKSLRSNPNIVRPIPTSPYQQQLETSLDNSMRSFNPMAPYPSPISESARGGVELRSLWSNDTPEAEARWRSQQVLGAQDHTQPTNDFGDPGDVFAAETPRDGTDPVNDSRRGSPEGSPKRANTGASRTPRQMVETLAMIHGQLLQQSSQGQQNFAHQQQVSRFIIELSSFMSEESQRRDVKQQELADAIRSIQEHVASLPDALLARLNAAARHSAENQPTTVDTDSDPLDSVDLPQVTRTVPGSRGLIKPEPFVELERKMRGAEAKDKEKKASLSRKIKGPRPPMTIAGQRLWGAPEPLGDRRGRWGAGAATVAKAQETKQINAVVDQALEDAKKTAPHQALTDAIVRDEELGRILSDVAQGDTTDARTMALAIYEILRTTRELSKQQEAQAAKEMDEGVTKGLTRSERAELDAKKREIERLELITESSNAHAAQIDELITKLNAKGEKTDALLKSISNAVSSPRAMQMDPSLTEATKKLLGSVKQGVDTHVKEFRGQLTSEVQRMVKEVGKLRDEKKELQATIADLLAFQAKQGSKTSFSAVAAATAPAARAPASPAKPKAVMPSTGFFGPRPLQ